MIFLNDEASEIGGLIFGGHRNAKGEIVDSGASLSGTPSLTFLDAEGNIVSRTAAGAS